MLDASFQIWLTPKTSISVKITVVNKSTMNRLIMALTPLERRSFFLWKKPIIGSIIDATRTARKKRY
jgi:hypothetical protein